MFFKKNRSPITIYVTTTDWKALGDSTPRSKWLYSCLVKQGGISESVPPGIYHFNVERIGFKLQASLLPAEN
jgi:hypothetical protein